MTQHRPATGALRAADPQTSAVRLGLSDEYWSRLSERDRKLYALVRPRPEPGYQVDVGLSHLERQLGSIREDCESAGGIFELEPDFQRGHVWTNAQRSAYVESLIRGQAPRTIIFNCPGWQRGMPAGQGAAGGGADIPGATFQCVDGLQRLTAARLYLAGAVKVFGGLSMTDLAESPFSHRRIRLSFAIYEFSRRADLLSFYLDLNSGGTVHSEAELRRVRGLLEAASTDGGEAEIHGAMGQRLDVPRPA